MMTTDKNEWTPGLTLVDNLLHHVIATYPIDKNRIYGSGQSQGGMANIAMNTATKICAYLGTKIATSPMWDSHSTPEQFDALVKATVDQKAPINYTVFKDGNHMYTWSVAYNIEGIRDCLFRQTNEK